MDNLHYEREVLKFTPKEAQEIIAGDSEEYRITRDKIVENNRWSILHEIIVQRKTDNKFFMAVYQVGSTEQQDEQPFEYDTEALFKQVYETKITVTDYI